MPKYSLIAAAISAAFACTASRAAQPPSPRVDQVIIVFKTHFDIGYTDMAANVVQRYRTTMIEQALRVVDQNRDLPADQQFVWTIPGWPMSKILEDWPGQTAQRKERVLQAFKDGRFVVHALPFTTHTETLELEDLVRGMNFASRLSRQIGKDLPRDAKMTDVPCHTWILPTMLRHAGVDFLHLGCNAASRSPQIPPLFFWQGPDGSRLLTMYTAESYGTGLIPPKDWPCKTWLALIHTGDNHGPPNPEEVKKLLDEAHQKLPGVRVRIGRLSDFADAVLAEKPDLPVVRGDMPDTWIHGPMCDPVGWAIARDIRPKIAAAEALGTQMNVWGTRLVNVAEYVPEAYEKSLLYGEHTWGGALYWIRPFFAYGDTWKKNRADGRFTKLEASWAEHTAYIEFARDIIAPLLDSELTTLATSVKADGLRIAVYNPLPYKRDGLVSVDAGADEIVALKPADADGRVPVESAGGKLRFIARDVPAMGYRTYVPTTIEATLPALGADEASSTIENEFFKATLDRDRGIVRSLIDKRTNRELIDGTAQYGFGQYLYERFDADNVKAFVKAYVKINTDWALNELGKPIMPPADQVPYRAASPAQFKLRLERTAVSVSAIMESAKSDSLPAITTKLTLYRDLPNVDLELTVHDKPADPWPEAGWICLPLKVTDPQFRLARLGSIVDPAKDIVPGSNHHLFVLNGGLTVTDANGIGAGLCPIDHPLVSLDTPGCWKYSADFVPKKPVVFVNLFNNQWTTNFRMWNSGTWTSRVRLWSVDRADAEVALVTPSQEARLPMLAASFRGAAGKLPPIQRGVELSRRGIAVTAFGPNPDGVGTIIRLWELAGKSGPCKLTLPPGSPPVEVVPVDLRGRALGQPNQVKDGAFEANVDAFAPASFLIRP